MYSCPTALFCIFAIFSTIPSNSDARATPTEVLTMNGQCKCPQVTFKVCGTDGETYKNLCELECRLKRPPYYNVKFYRFGPCTGDEAPECNCPGEWKPICADNGITYGSKCIFDCERKINPGLKIVKGTACVLPYFIHWMRPGNIHQMKKMNKAKAG